MNTPVTRHRKIAPKMDLASRSPKKDVASDTVNILQTRTFWANILGPILLWIGTKYGINMNADTQTIIIFGVMSLTNIIIRRFTTKPVTILPVTWRFTWRLH